MPILVATPIHACVHNFGFMTACRHATALRVLHNTIAGASYLNLDTYRKGS